MIVLDNSAAVELLLSLPAGADVRGQLDAAQWQIAAPQQLILEVRQVLRRRVAAGLSTIADADEALHLLDVLGVHFFDHESVAERVWQLRENLTAYDAAYVALAEAIGVPLVTTDSRLASAPGNNAEILLVGS
ncbi:type II toxin-antitoxin system VapC family toxin [Microbacterium sp.]|uniref:type II toxin-antitoxin system VapC family toxin n=1 Tax=Microbacterium sp. TaxID=51671 RepID=UPI003C7654D2